MVCYAPYHGGESSRSLTCSPYTHGAVLGYAESEK